MKSDPHPVPDGEQALRRMFSEPAAFTDTLPPVASLDEARRRRTRLAGLLTIAAAAVTAGVLVTANLGALTTAPAPANTASVEAASDSATPTPTPTPSASASPTPAPTPGPTRVPAASNACLKENVSGTEAWFTEQLPKTTIAACAGDWIALNASAGGQTAVADWFWVGKLTATGFLVDLDQPWSQVPGWESANDNDERLTAEQYMDRQFASKGIPVELRKALVGSPAPGSLAEAGIKTYEDYSTGYKVSFNYPATWQLASPFESHSMANGAGTSLTDADGKEVARLALGDTSEWTGCLNEAPYKVIDSQPMPGLPFNPASPEQGTPRFVYVAMTSAANDGGPVQAGIGITNRIAGMDGIACVLDIAVAGPDPLKFYSFSNRRPLGGPTWGLYNFQTMEEAVAFSQTQAYHDLKSVITSLSVTAND